MPRTKRKRQARYTAPQRGQQCILAIVRLQRRAIPATVARIAAEINMAPSTKLRQLLRQLEVLGLIHADAQLRQINFADDVDQFWIDKFGWRRLYSVRLSDIREKSPDTYKLLLREYDLHHEVFP